MLEIIILAAIAGFFIYKLNSVLGQEDEPKDRLDLDNVSHLNLNKRKYQTERVVEVNERLSPALAQIQKVDPSFTPEGFLTGAEKAFRMIIEAYNDNSVDEIGPYLTNEIYKKFTSAVKARQKAGEFCHNNIMRVKPATIEKATLKGDFAQITVKFESEQIIATADANGNLISGDYNEINYITDIWTFERNLTANSPNWVLISTS